MRRPLLFLASLLLAVNASAQTRMLTIEDLYEPQKRIDFSGGAPVGLTWISDTHYIWAKPASGSVDWVKVEATTGTSEPLFDAARMRDAFAALPGLRADDVARLPNQRGLEFNASHTAVVLSIADDLYYYQFSQPRAVTSGEWDLRTLHGVTDPALVKHLRQMMLDFMQEVLVRGGDARTPTSARR